MGNSSFIFPPLSQDKAEDKAAQLLRIFPTTKIYAVYTQYEN